MNDDAPLSRAVDWFRAQPDMTQRFAGAIRQSFDEVFDDQRTGRYSLDDGPQAARPQTDRWPPSGCWCWK